MVGTELALYVLNGLLFAASLFLVAAGLQIIFGVLGIINLAVGSFYAIGAYIGVELTRRALEAGVPPQFSVFILLFAAVFALIIAPPIEIGLLRPIYKRDPIFQLLLTYGIVLVFEDIIKLIWGVYPQAVTEPYLVYGSIKIGETMYPIYNLIVIGISFTVAALLEFMLHSTKIGVISRATSYDREMSSALGVNVKNVYLQIFIIGTALGILSGSMMAPIQAAVSGLSIEIIVLAFAIVVIAGLGSIKGAFIASIMVGLIRSIGIAFFPEIELAIIYLIVIVVLLVKPSGLFGKEVGG